MVQGLEPCRASASRLESITLPFTIASANYSLTPPHRRYLEHSIGRPFGAQSIKLRKLADVMALASGSRRRITIRTISAAKVHRAARWKGRCHLCPWQPRLCPGQWRVCFVESVCSDRAMLRVHKSLQSSRVPPHSVSTARSTCRVALSPGLSCRHSSRHDRFVLGRLPLTCYLPRVPRFGGLETGRTARACRDPCPRFALVPDEAPQVAQQHGHARFE